MACFFIFILTNTLHRLNVFRIRSFDIAFWIGESLFLYCVQEFFHTLSKPILMKRTLESLLYQFFGLFWIHIIFLSYTLKESPLAFCYHLIAYLPCAPLRAVGKYIFVKLQLFWKSPTSLLLKHQDVCGALVLFF